MQKDPKENPDKKLTLYYSSIEEVQQRFLKCMYQYAEAESFTLHIQNKLGLQEEVYIFLPSDYLGLFIFVMLGTTKILESEQVRAKMQKIEKKSKRKINKKLRDDFGFSDKKGVIQRFQDKTEKFQEFHEILNALIELTDSVGYKKIIQHYGEEVHFSLEKWSEATDTLKDAQKNLMIRSFGIGQGVSLLSILRTSKTFFSQDVEPRKASKGNINDKGKGKEKIADQKIKEETIDVSSDQNEKNIKDGQEEPLPEIDGKLNENDEVQLTKIYMFFIFFLSLIWVDNRFGGTFINTALRILMQSMTEKRGNTN